MTNSHITAPTRFIEAGGVRFAHRRFGAPTGIPVLFLQHFRGGLDNWDPTVTDGLGRDRPVILFNNAGVASSGGEPADTVSGMANHVVTFIHALGLKQVDLLGFSLGGFVAQQVVLESPDLIRRVVLAGTGPQGGEGMDAFTPKVAEQATQETPVIENFLYLSFAPSETSQAAGRAFGSVVTRALTKICRLQWQPCVPRQELLRSGEWSQKPIDTVNSKESSSQSSSSTGATTSWCRASTPLSFSSTSRMRR
jgi:pimeloyl-ACP methyl ester carboxylesterase